jgi:hypothetical protein
MRTLQLHFPDDALATLHTVLKQTKDARVLRRAQAVHEVVKGTRLHTGSDTRAFPSSTLSTWAHHFTQAGAPGLVGRPRSGRPPTVTCALDMQLNRLVEQEPLPHGFLILSGVAAYSPRRTVGTGTAAGGTARGGASHAA